MKKYRVGILLYDFFDILDFAGPCEVLSLATFSKLQQNILLYKRLLPKNKPFQVHTLSETGKPIKAHTGTLIHPDFSFENAPAFDILIIPGAPLRGINKVKKNKKIIDYIINAKNIEMICTVCSGSLLLAETGLLNGKAATTHHKALSILRNQYEGIQVMKDKRVIQDGNIITSGGISSGINMALYIIGKLVSKETALRTARTLEFNGYLETEIADMGDQGNDQAVHDNKSIR